MLKSQVAGSFQPNSSTSSAICKGKAGNLCSSMGEPLYLLIWKSASRILNKFSQHVPSTAALLDWLYSRKTGSLEAGGDQITAPTAPDENILKTIFIENTLCPSTFWMVGKASLTLV